MIGRPTTPPAARRAPVGIQSVEIALAVLQAMVRQGGPASLGELSRATRLEPSKLHRYLVSLSRCGMAAKSPVNGLYDLGPAARQLGAAAFSRFDGFGLVQDRVPSLATELGHTVLLFVWTEQGATLIRVQNGLRPPSMALRIGSSVPLRTSGVGQVFLAYLPGAVTEPLVRQQQAEGDDTAGPDPELPRRLARIRDDGMFWTATPILPGSELLAVPVFEAQHRLHSIIAVVLPPRAVTPALKQAVIARVLDTAGALSAELGDTWSGPPQPHHDRPRPGPA